MTVETFLGDEDVREIPWTKVSGTPAALTPDRVLIGEGSDALEVAVATAPAAPKTDEVRRLWNLRWNRRAAPVLLVVAYEADGGWKAAVCGTKDDPAALVGLDLAQVERICAAALSAADPATAARTLHRLLVGQKDQLVAGLTNSGLFASHELRTGVPSRPDWVAQRHTAQPLLRLRGMDLIAGLGFSATPYGSTALLLTGHGTHEAAAVLLDDHDVYDRPAARFGAVSPVAHGLAVAQANNVPWLVVLCGSQIRLYSAKPDVGVGRKGQTETFTEIDLALLPEDDAAYLTLLFSVDALASNGSVAQILRASADHAAALGQRLRERVYVDVVPDLAKAVAIHMGGTTEQSLAEAYHATLIILFRLLFIAYAEDRGLLPYQRNPRYTKKALKTLAREFADNPDLAFDPDATDRWDDLLAVWRAIDDGNREWGVPAYDGGLFATDDDHPSGQAIAAMRLTNAQLGPALRSLLVDAGPDGVGPVDFRSLSVREFGTIYEGLLESSLSIAPSDLTVDARTKAYLPAKPGDDITVRAGDVYFHNASGARKATGSYFTKSFAVEHLLDTALEPALADHLARVKAAMDLGDEAKATDLFFDFRVGDLAMGSGHFLVAAIDRIENRFSAFLTANPIPLVTDELDRLANAARSALGMPTAEIEVDRSALLRRQIARRCIYGLDLNEIAVELARLAIWIHTFVPGLPMSALDHGLVVGNSLTGIGTINELLDVLEPQRVPGQYSLFADQVEVALVTARDRLVRAARTAEATKAEVRDAAKAHTKAMEDAADAKALLDAAIGVRLGVIALPTGPESAIREGKQPRVQAKVAELKVAHLPYLFPEVFLRERPGFDVLLGNPPWEKVKVEEHQWWALRFPGLRSMPQKDKNAAIARYRRERRDLLVEYEAEVTRVEDLKNVLAKGPFPGLRAATDTDLSLAFAWRFWHLLATDGRFGIVLPRGILSGSAGAEWRQTLLNEGAFSDVTLLSNSRQWIFDEVHPQYTVALTSVTKGREHSGSILLRGPFFSLDEFTSTARISGHCLPADQFETWADGAAFPLLPTAHSVEVFTTLRAHPRLDAPHGDWQFIPLRELHTTDNKDLFDFDLGHPDGDVPVLTGGSFNLWAPDFGDPYAFAKSSVLVPWLECRRLRQIRLSRSAFYGMPQEWATSRETLPMLNPRIAFRDVARSTDSRTVIVALIPPGKALVEIAPYLFRRKGNAADEAYLLGVLSSIPLDWYSRRYVELHLKYNLLNAFPIPRPPAGDPLRQRVVEIAGRLAAVDARYAEWAAQVGVPVGSVSSSAAKDDLVAELDAVVALLYGLDRSNVQHIFTTFHRGWDYHSRLDAVLAHYDSWKERVAA